MTTDSKRPKGKHGARREPPAFIRAGDLAWHLGCDTQTLHRWVDEGIVPPPHSRLGPNSTLWLRRHFDAFVATGRWPEESFKGRVGG
jgi:predicted DNA-binding transcriptional regulator AlpA